ncbi:MAG: RloB family protein [Alphaproteobacteria bacterium]
MPRDNSPKERQNRQLERKKSRRASRDRILIVSEGSRTRPLYFNEIRSTYRLHSANVVVLPSTLGTSPKQVVESAVEEFQKARAFEQVYAVFDLDAHVNYYDALNNAMEFNGKLRNDLRQPVCFRAVASVPDFELWLLLHYEDIQVPIHRNDVLQRLKKHIPNYEKGASGVFSKTRPNLETAIQRAERLALINNAHTDPEPYTAIVDLVKLLTGLKSP